MSCFMNMKGTRLSEGFSTLLPSIRLHYIVYPFMD
jgi:hypothetical protein